MIGAGGLFYGIGETYRGRFSTFNSSGAQADADSTPTGVLVVNGSDTAVTVTVTSQGAGTGRYAASCSLSGRSIGDDCHVRISATVGGVTQIDTLPAFRIVFGAALSGAIVTSGTGANQLSVSAGKVSVAANGIATPQNYNNAGFDGFLAAGTTSSADSASKTLTFNVSSGSLPTAAGSMIVWTGGSNRGGSQIVTNVSGTTLTVDAMPGDIVDGDAAVVLATNETRRDANFYGLAMTDQGTRIASSAQAATLNTGQTSILSAVNNLNNLSALANLYGPSVMEIPDSSTTQYPFTLTVRDSEGHLVDLDASPVSGLTLTAANSAGTDRSANLSSVTHVSTGIYQFTYGVASTATEEGLRIKVSGVAVSSSARYVEFIGSIVNYDSITTLLAVKATIDANLDATISSRASQASVDAIPTASNIDTQLSNTHGSGQWGSTGSGTGSYARTITVTDTSGNALQNATVTYSLNGSVVAIGTTNALGATTLNVNAATYDVAITCDRFNFNGTTDVVSGSGSPDPFQMTPITPSPAAIPSQTTGYTYTRDLGGTIKASVKVYIQRVTDASGDDDSYDTGIRTYTSDSNGLLQVTLEKGATYHAWRGRIGRDGGGYATLSVPADAGSTWEFDVSVDGED